MNNSICCAFSIFHAPVTLCAFASSEAHTCLIRRVIHCDLLAGAIPKRWERCCLPQLACSAFPRIIVHTL